MSRQIGSRFLFASIAFAGLTTSPAFSQPPQAQDLAIEQTLMLGLANQLEQCLDRELERVSRLCNADETELKTLRQNLKPEVDKYLELRRVQGKTPSDFVVRYLPKQLSDAIGAELRKLGNSGVDAFETDIATRREFRRETTIELLIHAMDAHVCITQDQEKQLRELFARDWNEDWIHLTENQMFDWGGRVFPVIPSGEIKNVLTSQQFVTWQAVGKLPSWHETIGFGGPPPKKEKWDATIEELRQRTRDAIRLRIVALKHDFDLSDLQVKRLQVAAKGCLEQVIGIHHTAYDQYANKIAKVQVGEGLDVDYEMLLTIVMPPAQLMDAKTDWPKFVLGTMDNKQKQHFQNRRKDQNQKRHKALMGVLATSFDTEKSFTGKQLRAYQRLFVDATDTSETVSFDTYRKVLRIPKDDWRALASPGQWPAIEAMLEALEDEFR